MARDQASGGSSISPARPPLSPELTLRLTQALRGRSAETSPSNYARPVYDVLVQHGLRRRDLLAVASSLMDLVMKDVIRSPRGTT